MTSDSPLRIRFDDLCQRHEAVLFDAYGVLVDAEGALPGAVEAIAALRSRQQPLLVVTNDASRSPARAAGRLRKLGIDVGPEHILSSGMMIAPALRERSVEHLRVVVLGTRDSADYVREAGAQVVAASLDAPADVIVVADEGGFDVLPVMDDVLSMAIEAVRRGRPPRLLLANPDLIYPSGTAQFGFTAGSLAHMLERALELVLGEAAPTFEILGKPSPRLFTAALTRLGVSDAVMIGDQLHTDIAGARAAGIASALLLGGVSHDRAATGFGGWTPTYLLASLERTADPAL